MGYKKGEILKTAFETYAIRGQRGCGGSGEVYEITDGEGSVFAAKILDQAKATRSRLKRFQNEISFCSKIAHRNIVPVLGHGVTSSGATFYVMPLYSGTLRDLMSKGVAPEAVLPYFGQILDGVDAAHLLRVWHRDIKPENILFSASDNTLVIADFGIAHSEEEELLTAVETKNQDRLANFVYSAPEQRSRNREVTGKVDIYALGLIFNQIFTGEIPLGTQFKRIESSAPDFAYLDKIVEQMIRQEPAQRPFIRDIKQELIARKQQFISLQKIDQLTKQVIREDSINDPLIIDPIRAQNFDYRDGFLLVSLSRVPNPLWIQKFHAQATTSFLGMGPGEVTFQASLASVPVRKDIVVQQKSYFEGWIRNANGLYEGAIKRQMEEEKRIREQELQRRLAKERERQDILKLLGAS